MLPNYVITSTIPTQVHLLFQVNNQKVVNPQNTSCFHVMVIFSISLQACGDLLSPDPPTNQVPLLQAELKQVESVLTGTRN